MGSSFSYSELAGGHAKGLCQGQAFQDACVVGGWRDERRQRLVVSHFGGEAAEEVFAATVKVSEGRGFAATRVTACPGVGLDTTLERSPEVTIPFLLSAEASSSPWSCQSARQRQPDLLLQPPRRPGDSGSASSLPFSSR